MSQGWSLYTGLSLTVLYLKLENSAGQVAMAQISGRSQTRDFGATESVRCALVFSS